MNHQLRAVCGARATMGTLVVGALSLRTIEPPWRDNQADVSCVPAGDYQLLPYVSPKHGKTWRLHNPALGVWGLDDAPPTQMRTEVEIHTGNLASQSEACLLVGMAASEMLDPTTNQVEPAVLDSVVAMNHLREALEASADSHTLTIARSGLYPNQ